MCFSLLTTTFSSSRNIIAETLHLLTSGQRALQHKENKISRRLDRLRSWNSLGWRWNTFIKPCHLKEKHMWVFFFSSLGNGDQIHDCPHTSADPYGQREKTKPSARAVYFFSIVSACFWDDTHTAVKWSKKISLNTGLLQHWLVSVHTPFLHQKKGENAMRHPKSLWKLQLYWEERIIFRGTTLSHLILHFKAN